MVGLSPLRRSLLEMSDDKKGLEVDEDDEGVIIFPPEGVGKEPNTALSDSGIIRHMFSSSLTTSAMEGLFSVSS